ELINVHSATAPYCFAIFFFWWQEFAKNHRIRSTKWCVVGKSGGFSQGSGEDVLGRVSAQPRHQRTAYYSREVPGGIGRRSHPYKRVGPLLVPFPQQRMDDTGRQTADPALNQA